MPPAPFSTQRPATFPQLLDHLLRQDGARPLVTFYDGATGERTELSVTTYANWVAKTASLLAEECDLERGGTLRVDLPTHWLGPVVLGAAWSVGATVDLDGTGQAPDVVVCGPDALATWAPRADEVSVVASALLPLAVRFPEPPAPGVLDLGTEVWSQPDVFVPLEQPQGDDEALPGTSQSALLAAARAGGTPGGPDSTGDLVGDGGRLLTEANPASTAGLACFTQPLARGGSLVLLTRCEPERAEAIRAEEQATARH